MSDTPKRPPVELFTEFHEATSLIQLEMSKVLVTDKDAAKQLKELLKMPDCKQMEILEKAAHQFVSMMPMAQMNGVNLISMVMALHSNLTGDPTFHDIYDKVNRKVNRKALDLPEPD